MKTVSATEAKNRLGALIGDVVSGREDIVIENHGTPRAVLISFDHYRELVDAREQRRRREAMEDLRQLRAEVLAQNQDLDDEAREQLIEEISSEVRANLNARMRRLSQEQRG
jgi:prevent-host-death family protein